MSSKPSYDSAARTADQNAQTSLAALPAGAKLDSMGTTANPCTNQDSPPPSTPVSITTDYFVIGLQASHNRTYLDTLVAYWKRAGWEVHADNRPHDQFVSLKKSGYGLVFQLSTDGSRLGLSTTTPCVTPQRAHTEASS